MDTNARIGSFSAPNGVYGMPVLTVKPPDNSINPQTAPAATIADAQAAALDAIYAQLKAASTK